MSPFHIRTYTCFFEHRCHTCSDSAEEAAKLGHTRAHKNVPIKKSLSQLRSVFNTVFYTNGFQNDKKTLAPDYKVTPFVYSAVENTGRF